MKPAIISLMTKTTNIHFIAYLTIALVLPPGIRNTIMNLKQI